jgi:hypothetical protein
MYQTLSTDVKVMEKQRQDADVVRFLIGLKPEYELICAQMLGGSDIPSLPEVFSRIQQATLLDNGSQISTDCSGDSYAFLASRGSSGSSLGGRGGCGGHSSRGGSDS